MTPVDRDQYQFPGLGFQADVLAQDAMVFGAELLVAPAAHPRRQEDRTEANSLQARDLCTHGLPQASYLAISAFQDRHREPGVSAGDFSSHDITEAARTVLEHDAFAQLFDLFLADRAPDAAQVFAIDLA